MDDTRSAIPNLVMKHAASEDAPLVHDFLIRLMTYQKLVDEVTVTPDRIALLLREGHAEAVFASLDGEPVGALVFSATCSIYTGRRGLFIDGFYVDEGLRGRGVGKALMAYLAKLSIARGGDMLEWGCLDWNKPTIAFYEGLGAYCLDNMRVYRLASNRLQDLARRHGADLT